MIVRLIATDPRPRLDSKTDLIVYQVPEHSREIELLLELFEKEGIEYAIMEGGIKRKKVVEVNKVEESASPSPPIVEDPPT